MHNFRSSVTSPTSKHAILGATAGAAALAALTLSHATAGERNVLVFVGFDPPRAALLTAFTACAFSGFVAGAVSGQRRLSALLGAAALIALFGRTMASEVEHALRASGSRGAFDPVGFAVSAIALGVAGLGVGWASGTLGAEVRTAVGATARYTLQRVRNRGMLGLLNVRIARSVVLVIALALSVTALSDMLNYSPDALYRVGSSAVGMFNSPSAPTGIVRPVRHDGPSPAPSAGQPSSEPSRTPQPAPTFPPGPTTPGSIDTVSLPAFWTGDPLATATVSVYLPGDYGSGGGPYPVVYTAPWVYDSWERAVHVRELLDGMIAAGEIPPTIVVFAGLGGGPYADTECVNSYDGRSEAETYLAVTVPSWIDSHYRTIRDAQHRTIMGFSEGAYCAAMLLLGHPDVFHEGICFGGYYTAGIRGPQTLNAWRPFGPSGAGIDSHSPIWEAHHLDPSIAHQLNLFVSGTSSEPFYGPQFVAFQNEINADGIRAAFVDTYDAHSWPAVRADLPAALKATAVDIANRATAP